MLQNGRSSKSQANEKVPARDLSLCHINHLAQTLFCLENRFSNISSLHKNKH